MLSYFISGVVCPKLLTQEESLKQLLYGDHLPGGWRRVSNTREAQQETTGGAGISHMQTSTLPPLHLPSFHIHNYQYDSLYSYFTISLHDLVGVCNVHLKLHYEIIAIQQLVVNMLLSNEGLNGGVALGLVRGPFLISQGLSKSLSEFILSL